MNPPEEYDRKDRHPCVMFDVSRVADRLRLDAEHQERCAEFFEAERVRVIAGREVGALSSVEVSHVRYLLDQTASARGLKAALEEEIKLLEYFWETMDQEVSEDEEE